MGPFVEGEGNAVEGLDGDACRDVRRFGERFGVEEGQDRHGTHGGRAVVEGESFLRAKLHGREPGSGEGFRRGHSPTAEAHLAEAEERQGQVGEGAEVAARTEGPLAWDERVDSKIEKGHELVQHCEADAGEAPDEAVDPKEHHGPDHVLGEGLAHTAGMALQKIFLKKPPVLPGDLHRGEIAEPRGDSVDHVIGTLPGLHGRGGLLDSAARFV